MQDYRNLEVWKKAHQLTLDVYRVTTTFPKDELFGLTSQTRRAAASIPANLAEGCGRNSNAELNRYISIAQGSANELEYHLLLARDLGYLNMQTHDPLAAAIAEIRRMLTGLSKRLRE